MSNYYKLSSFEKDFIRLSYPLSSIQDIANILNLNKRKIKIFVSNNKLKRIKQKVQIGDKFGKIEVLSLLKDGTYKEKIWECKCDCGNVRPYKHKNITSRRAFSCGCDRLLSVNKSGKYISGTFFSSIRCGAKQRNIEIDLDLPFLDNLLEQQNFQCKISGIKLYTHLGAKTKDITISLDRIDNTKGYTKDNVQWVHKDINMMKWTHKQDYLLYLCRTVSEYNKDKIYESN